MPKHIFFIGRQILRSAPAFLFFRFFDSAQNDKKQKELRSTRGASLGIFRNQFFFKITFSEKYNQPFLRFTDSSKNAERVQNNKNTFHNIQPLTSNIQNFRIFALHEKNSLLIPRNWGRKVRTSQSSIKVNNLPS